MASTAFNEWQIAGIKRAIASLDRGDGVPHERVKEWIASWGSDNELPVPKRSTHDDEQSIKGTER